MGSEKDKDRKIKEMIEQRELTNDALKKLLDSIDSNLTKPEEKKGKRKSSNKR